MTTLPDAARAYRDQGLSVFPCRPRDKRPLIDSWLPYQTEPCTLDELDVWWGECPTANIAIATGRGVMVVDLDGDGAEQLLWDQGIVLPDAAPRVRTGKGEHVYLAVSRKVGNKAGVLAGPTGKPAVDIRGDGGYVLAPPSIHPDTGTRYEWLRPFAFPLPAAPDRLLDVIGEHRDTRPGGHLVSVPAGPGWVTQALAGVPEGQRDQTCARLAGHLLAKGLGADVTIAILADFGARCAPPFPLLDIQRVVRSIGQREATKGTDQEAEPEAEQGPHAEHIGEVLDQALAAIKKGPQRSAPTGFGGLHRLLSGGFFPGELIYLGARPGQGKTAFALEIARATAKAGQTVLFVSREMMSIALVRRMLAQHGAIRARSLKTGQIADWHPVMAAAGQLAGLPIWFSDSALSMQDVRIVMGAVPQTVDLVLVDYLQLVRAPRGIGERRHQVEAISKELKALAMQCKIPVVCLSSLSRPSEGKERPPRLSDLRESGELEHDADVVMFLHREKGEETDCIVAKNRDGETGVVTLLFRKEFVSFAEKTGETESQYPEDARFEWRDR